jgi:hypothetical protein
LASVIVDRTHAVRGSGIEAPSAAISPLGLRFDLIWHKVFMHTCTRMMARSGGASTNLVGTGGWMDGRGSIAVARSLRCAREWKRKRRRKMKGMGSTPPWAVLFIGGSTETIRCSSFHRTKRLNGTILRSSQENQCGIFAKQVTTTT